VFVLEEHARTDDKGHDTIEALDVQSKPSSSPPTGPIAAPSNPDSLKPAQIIRALRASAARLRYVSSVFVLVIACIAAIVCSILAARLLQRSAQSVISYSRVSSAWIAVPAVVAMLGIASALALRTAQWIDGLPRIVLASARPYVTVYGMSLSVPDMLTGIVALLAVGTLVTAGAILRDVALPGPHSSLSQIAADLRRRSQCLDRMLLFVAIALSAGVFEVDALFHWVEVTLAMRLDPESDITGIPAEADITGIPAEAALTFGVVFSCCLLGAWFLPIMHLERACRFLARSQVGPAATDEQRRRWLEENGLLVDARTTYTRILALSLPLLTGPASDLARAISG
jgi:hypothetical protein